MKSIASSFFRGGKKHRRSLSVMSDDLERPVIPRSSVCMSGCLPFVANGDRPSGDRKDACLRSLVCVVSESGAVCVGVCARPTTKFFRLWASIPWPFFSRFADGAGPLVRWPAQALLGNHPEVHCTVQIVDRERASFFQMHAWSLPRTHRIYLCYVCLFTPGKSVFIYG